MLIISMLLDLLSNYSLSLGYTIVLFIVLIN